jgi:cytoskeleton protein RodZ
MVDSEEPSAITPAPATTSPGQILRDARVARDLTIEQLATELRIEARQLAALEEDRFDQIGVPVFVKGYLRQYAQRLGVDQQNVIALYSQKVQPIEVPIQPSRTIRLRDERQITVWVVAVLLLVLIIVGLGLWWFNGRIDIAGATRRALGAGAQLVPGKGSASSLPVAEAPPPARAAEPKPAPVADSAPPTEAVPEPEPAPVAAAPVAAADGDSDVTVGPAADDAGPQAAVAPIPLDLTLDGDSWVEITDATGKRLFFGLAAAGRHLTLRGEPPVAVVLGNADAVHLVVSGEPYAIPKRGRSSLVRFSIASDEE